MAGGDDDRENHVQKKKCRQRGRLSESQEFATYLTLSLSSCSSESQALNVSPPPFLLPPLVLCSYFLARGSLSL